jgi:hypothetical protein
MMASLYRLIINSVTMTDTEEEGWDRDSGDEEQSEQCDDEVVEVEGSGSSGSTKSILCFPERNDT